MINRLPGWFKQDIPDILALEKMRLFFKLNVHTVCREAQCPNFSYCFKNLEFTFMILGDTCTRNCRFCGVTKSNKDTLALDQDEPDKISQIVRILNLKFVVVTSVTRDDLIDGGAVHFAKTIELIHNIDKNIKLEVLIPDFSGNIASLKTVIEANPSILAHNLETVKRLYPIIRPKASYELSLEILSQAKELNPLLVTKSSLILGLGETEDEVIAAMQDLRYNQCDILTLGQYLAPSKEHYPVQEFIAIEQFKKYEQIGINLGFKAISSGPKVRSSYQAQKLYTQV